MMNDMKLNEYLNDYAKSHSPEPSRDLIDNIMRVPREVEQEASILSVEIPSKISEWFLFLVPRISGLTAACVMGIYFGGAGSSALAEDEIDDIDQTLIEVEQGIILDEEVDTLLDLEEFIFVEEAAQ
ncbi:MAG: hypothetical protein HOH18_06055 [Kordiimonadaceae bacterium]|jgi:hypothetical protein|nr:hypothetical protein [Kordiimonadaceae bacterium]MBT6036024.1 hypothetical protein [Kordiimonadaceae bacterium]MBT7583197.1 hypothetical protein [Kordiimonadaceae bacterium]